MTARSLSAGDLFISLLITLALLLGEVTPTAAQEPEPSPAAAEKLPTSPGDHDGDDLDHQLFLPVVASFHLAPPEDRNDVPAYVNYFRAVAGVPPVAFDGTLDNNCHLHARYMAEENHITHSERTSSPWYTPAGQVCAQRGNAWLGGASSAPIWEPHDSIEGWMGSTGHRLWLLYPTTPVFGFGFYTASNNRAGAALDVLSRFDSSADARYPDWPVRFPAPGQSGVPARRYPITLSWRYFGPSPTVTASSLTAEGGAPIAHTVTTALPVGHEGIEIRPAAPLPARTTIVVSVTGSYDGQPFEYSWSFATGD